jgi:quercetin 2,3-dioxygenase
MLELRKSGERGYADHGWLKSHHTFSFANYYDPDHGGFGVLRVINEDQVAPETGFGTHAHRDMEILSYVLEGELEHRDSMGNGSIIVPGDVQRMSAGRGVLHSEMNPSATKPVHFLQIWIQPNVRGIRPSYEEKHFPASVRRGRLKLVASHDGVDGSIRLHQDARVYAGLFNGKECDVLRLAPGRNAYVHVGRGRVSANGIALEPGDGLKLTDILSVELSGGQTAELLVFDLPA